MKLFKTIGQKGTIGVTYRQEDMPFTADGIIPDLIINPHAIPSRMTIGHLMECAQSKGAAISGTIGDATSFSAPSAAEIGDELKRYGYESQGYEVLYNGQTGRKLKAHMFIGPTYYQRLKHMTKDKLHGRSRGPLQILTKQPVEGRSRDGGLRFGEMERASYFHLLILFVSCDLFLTLVYVFFLFFRTVWFRMAPQPFYEIGCLRIPINILPMYAKIVACSVQLIILNSFSFASHVREMTVA